jgi:hypothetical protein
MEKSHGASEQGGKRTRMFSRLIVMIVLANPLIGAMSAERVDEYRVKAAFLYNFAKFIDWPPEAFRSSGQPFGICVLGEDPFGHGLDDIVSGRTISGRSIVIRRISDAREADVCHILFVSSSLSKRSLSILAAEKMPGVLRVGECAKSASREAIILFTLDGGKVRFEIDLIAAERQNLRISSKLLTLASFVRR